ncbi:MAG: DUF2927 domain-containing protein [Thalassovita sp.]
MKVNRIIKTIAAGAVLALAGCVETTAPTKPGQGATLAQPSAQSRALSTYYARLQADLLVQGLLRTDGGGPDTPYSAAMLARNFEKIAFFDEYERGAGLQASRAGAGVLRRWKGPVRVAVQFGPDVPKAQQTQDMATVSNYVARLQRVTGHPITMRAQDANFHVLIMSEDDGPTTLARVRQIVPNINPASLQIIQNIPRSIHCLVLAFSEAQADHHYAKAIAIIRSEHPDLLRKSCVHEEIAQGLGLANDSPAARPSIFNDDDEFALLTTHDEMLLKILYDRRLHAGISAEAARPIIRQIARELTGGSS